MNSSRLATVLRVGELRERAARAEAAAARRAAAELEDRRHRVATDLRRFAAEAPTTAGALRVQRSALTVGAVELDAAVRTAHAARTDVDRAVAGWAVAARDREGIERLEQRLQTAERADGERREAAEVDDLVVTRWRPRPADRRSPHEAAHEAAPEPRHEAAPETAHEPGHEPGHGAEHDQEHELHHERRDPRPNGGRR